MRAVSVSTKEISEAGGVLSAAYYTRRKPGETYRQWRDRDHMEAWVAARIELLEKRLGSGPTGLPCRKMGRPLWELQRELYLHELALLRMKAKYIREEMG
jgi:hypothetical protein